MRRSTALGMVGLLRHSEPVDARESIEPRMTQVVQWGPPASDYWRPSPQERARKRNERKAKRRARG